MKYLEEKIKSSEDRIKELQILILEWKKQLEEKK
tara:strand:+ start:457 stop:558 length:102 start_codon:yes stop_codon:yes gene_type:complete